MNEVDAGRDRTTPARRVCRRYAAGIANSKQTKLHNNKLNTRSQVPSKRVVVIGGAFSFFR
jgi:hypothetical protein